MAGDSGICGESSGKFGGMIETEGDFGCGAPSATCSAPSAPCGAPSAPCGAPSAPCQRAETGEVVGRCAYCDAPWASLEGGVTCAVCRDPVLACDACRRALPVRDEYHCPSHFELRHCYFRSLDKWAAGSGESDISNVQALRLQAAELDRFEQALRGDKLQRNRRCTLRRQRARVLEQLASFSENT